MVTARRTLSATLGRGLLLCLAWLLYLFLGSLVLRSASDAPSTTGNIIVAILMLATSFVFARRVRPDNRQKAIGLGVVWVVVLVIIQLAMAVPNGTLHNVFGLWSGYLTYVAIIAGTALQPQQPRPPATRIGA